MGDRAHGQLQQYTVETVVGPVWQVDVAQHRTGHDPVGVRGRRPPSPRRPPGFTLMRVETRGPRSGRSASVWSYRSRSKVEVDSSWNGTLVTITPGSKS